MSKTLIIRNKCFSIQKENPYRKRTIKIEGRLLKPTKIQIKVQQIDWTLKRKVDEREEIYQIDAEYDYVGLINLLYSDLTHIKYFSKIVGTWIEKNKPNFSYADFTSKN